MRIVVSYDSFYNRNWEKNAIFGLPCPAMESGIDGSNLNGAKMPLIQENAAFRKSRYAAVAVMNFSTGCTSRRKICIVYKFTIEPGFGVDVLSFVHRSTDFFRV